MIVNEGERGERKRDVSRSIMICGNTQYYQSCGEDPGGDDCMQSISDLTMSLDRNREDTTTPSRGAKDVEAQSIHSNLIIQQVRQVYAAGFCMRTAPGSAMDSEDAF